MDEATFRGLLQEQDYPEPVLLNLEPETFFETHAHSFSSFALVLSGEFSVKTDAGTTFTQAGEVFRVESNVAHSSWAGPGGAKVLTGRKRE